MHFGNRRSKRIALLPEKILSNSCRVADLYERHDRNAESRDAFAQKFRQYDFDARRPCWKWTSPTAFCPFCRCITRLSFPPDFLTPFSNGTQITYLDELSGEELSRAIENGHVTGMVGVPALWEMLHRRIKTRFRERGDWFADLADNVIEFNAWIRDNTPFNLGPIIFFPIHEGMGGRMRYLISGGSALSEKVQKDLHGLGFYGSRRLRFDRIFARFDRCASAEINFCAAASANLCRASK